MEHGRVVGFALTPAKGLPGGRTEAPVLSQKAQLE
jgi:hypothetical protein